MFVFLNESSTRQIPKGGRRRRGKKAVQVKMRHREGGKEGGMEGGRDGRGGEGREGRESRVKGGRDERGGEGRKDNDNHQLTEWPVGSLRGGVGGGERAP